MRLPQFRLRVFNLWGQVIKKGRLRPSLLICARDCLKHFDGRLRINGSMKIKSLIMAAAISACGFTVAQAQSVNNSTPPLGREHFQQRLAEKLNLTDDQKAQIKAVLGGEKDTLKSLVTQLRQARVGLRETIRAADANETSVRAAAAKAAAAEGNLAVERMKIYGKIAPILTDEQRRQISNFTQRADEFTDNAVARVGERLGE